MMPFLFRTWRRFPLWMHILASKLIRPVFRLAVGAMIFDDQGRVLLFKHTYRKFEWGIPAGGLEHNESPEDAVVREFREEAGMQIQVERLLLAISLKEDHNISLIYLCKIVSGEFRQSLEVSEMKYFAVNDLPPMLFTEKDLIRQVAKILKP